MKGSLIVKGLNRQYQGLVSTVLEFPVPFSYLRGEWAGKPDGKLVVLISSDLIDREVRHSLSARKGARLRRVRGGGFDGYRQTVASNEKIGCAVGSVDSETGSTEVGEKIQFEKASIEAIRLKLLKEIAIRIVELLVDLLQHGAGWWGPRVFHEAGESGVQASFRNDWIE